MTTYHLTWTNNIFDEFSDTDTSTDEREYTDQTEALAAYHRVIRYDDTRSARLTEDNVAIRNFERT
jgi:hypothetical protein